MPPSVRGKDSPGKPQKTVHIRMSDELLADIDILAGHYRLNRANFIRYALNEAVIWWAEENPTIIKDGEIIGLLEATKTALEDTKRNLEIAMRRIDVTRNLL